MQELSDTSNHSQEQDKDNDSRSIMELSDTSRDAETHETDRLFLWFPDYLRDNNLVEASEEMVELSGNLLNVEGAQLNDGPLSRELFRNPVCVRQNEFDRLKPGVYLGDRNVDFFLHW